MPTLFSSITALPTPHDDRLAMNAISPYFRDALAAPVSQSQLTPSQLQYAIFNYLPGWVNKLMWLRNKLVKIAGFNVGETSMAPPSDDLQVGDQAGFLTVIEKSDHEIISYAEDRHMTFYLSVKKCESTVVISSLVNQKTRIGQIYVNGILPFHYFIARIVINNAIKANRI